MSMFDIEQTEWIDIMIGLFVICKCYKYTEYSRIQTLWIKTIKI
jgi:hypothetical protein